MTLSPIIYNNIAVYKDYIVVYIVLWLCHIRSGQRRCYWINRLIVFVLPSFNELLTRRELPVSHSWADKFFKSQYPNV